MLLNALNFPLFCASYIFVSSMLLWIISISIGPIQFLYLVCFGSLFNTHLRFRFIKFSRLFYDFSFYFCMDSKVTSFSQIRDRLRCVLFKRFVQIRKTIKQLDKNKNKSSDELFFRAYTTLFCSSTLLYKKIQFI